MSKMYFTGLWRFECQGWQAWCEGLGFEIKWSQNQQPWNIILIFWMCVFSFFTIECHRFQKSLFLAVRPQSPCWVTRACGVGLPSYWEMHGFGIWKWTSLAAIQHWKLAPRWVNGWPVWYLGRYPGTPHGSVENGSPKWKESNIDIGEYTHFPLPWFMGERVFWDRCEILFWEENMQRSWSGVGLKSLYYLFSSLFWKDMLGVVHKCSRTNLSVSFVQLLQVLSLDAQKTWVEPLNLCYWLRQ